MMPNECFLMRHNETIRASTINGLARVDPRIVIHEQLSGASVAYDMARALSIQRSSPIRGVATPVLHYKVISTARRPAIFASSSGGEGPSLNKQEVVELLSVAVHTLLRPENQKRLRELLAKNNQAIHGEQSRVIEQASHDGHWSLPAAADSFENLEEAGYVDMEGGATNSGRSSDQVSLMTTSVTFPSTCQAAELAECEGPSQSIENMESCIGGVDGKGDNSLTSIRRLKVLDVHSYVHNALRESALRSWLNSRTIEE